MSCRTQASARDVVGWDLPVPLGLDDVLAAQDGIAVEKDSVDAFVAGAARHGARYALTNPLFSMGRGVKGRRALAAIEQRMLRIHQMTDPFDGSDLDVVRIRFPNTAGKPLAGCEAGTVIYVCTCLKSIARRPLPSLNVVETAARRPRL